MIVPAIILFEVYIVLKREVGEEKALIGAGYMKKSTVIPLDETLALAAADIALQESLAVADAIIVAAARAHSCKIVPSDSDLEDQPGVIYLFYGGDPSHQESPALKPDAARCIFQNFRTMKSTKDRRAAWACDHQGRNHCSGC